ncbi:hypothetical protein F4811DRAFT_203730 [Daldinia bambusicola]|nr:hypothetical protein F4811DRAFT_203730 [Daldinia bambusicola]
MRAALHMREEFLFYLLTRMWQRVIGLSCHFLGGRSRPSLVAVHISSNFLFRANRRPGCLSPPQLYHIASPNDDFNLTRENIETQKTPILPSLQR